MGSIKTAISLEKQLFEQIEALAKEMKVSRSRLFVLAAQEFLDRHENQKLLEAINHAYDDMPTAEENELLAQMRDRHAEVVKDQW
jgi:metal-responsive CopG/Arc/MetJ family transcriptional regulator